MKIMKNIIDIITGHLGEEKLDIDDIEPMRYPEGHEDERENFVNPFTKYNSFNSRIQYNKKRN